MLWADMPEAAIDEHCDFAASKHNVRPHSRIGEADHEVFTKAIPQRMERRPQAYLRLSIRPPVGLHVA